MSLTLTDAPAFSHFDWDHWYKVRRARQHLGISRKTEVGQRVPHPLVGRVVVETARGTRYVVESVKKDWLHGWFLMGLLNVNGSHRTCVVENLSSRDPSIVALAEEFARGFAAADH